MSRHMALLGIRSPGLMWPWYQVETCGVPAVPELRKQCSSSSPPAGHSSPFCTAMLPVALSPFQNICFVMEQRFCSGMVLSGEQGLDGLSTAVHW